MSKDQGIRYLFKYINICLDTIFAFKLDFGFLDEILLKYMAFFSLAQNAFY